MVATSAAFAASATAESAPAPVAAATPWAEISTSPDPPQSASQFTRTSFRAVLFADFGDVENDVRVGVVRASVGPGVRFTLPILGSTPISIYFGYPLVKAATTIPSTSSFQFGGLLQ